MKSLFRRALFAALFLSATIVSAAQTILVVGDSLSAAYGLPQASGWVNLLQQRLQLEKQPYRVVNASISGETSSGGLYRIPQLLAEHQPAIVLLELGANDGLRGLAPEATRANLEGIIQRARNSGARVLLIGMRLPPNYGPAYTEKFQAVFASLARQYQLPFVPFLLAPIADRRDAFQADGLHPVATAQAKLLGVVWPALQPLLKPVKNARAS